MPPSRASAMASRASVTVSIAADTIGISSVIVRVRRVTVDTSCGRTADSAGTSSTSSKARPSLPNLPSRSSSNSKSQLTLPRALDGTRRDRPQPTQRFLTTCAKKAVTPVAAVIGTVQRGLLPLQAPAQRANFHPLPGLAASTTGSNEATFAAQDAFAHLIAAGKLETTPRPVRPTRSANESGANTAVTVAAAASSTWHVPAPVHAPPQRTKRYPPFGSVERKTRAPLSQSTPHEAAQSTPATSLYTLPGPVIPTVRRTWSLTSRSQGEVCTPDLTEGP